jgi:hypothetical protein
LIVSVAGGGGGGGGAAKDRETGSSKHAANTAEIRRDIYFSILQIQIRK